MMATYYCVVQESGSYSEDYQYYEERHNCGHKHKTLAAAEVCLTKLTESTCEVCGRKPGKCRHNRQVMSAKWYGATIHDQDGRRVER